MPTMEISSKYLANDQSIDGFKCTERFQNYVDNQCYVVLQLSPTFRDLCGVFEGKITYLTTQIC